MAEMLSSLPADHPDRARILKGYKLMMAALLKYQGADGMWRQLIDKPESWEESSSTGMFTFALITGVKNGWLNGPTYGPAARKAWMGLVGFVDQNSNVTNVCEGTNKENNIDWYLQRHRNTGDFHGQETVLWSASALLR
jgi:rhamnogalacturonyl hydrolase YesR